MRTPGLCFTILAVLAILACDSVPSGGTLAKSLGDQLVAVKTVTEFDQQKNEIDLEFVSERYHITVTEATVEPYNEGKYTHIGRLKIQARVGGEIVDASHLLSKADINANDIVALWDSEAKQWDWVAGWEEEY